MAPEPTLGIDRESSARLIGSAPKEPTCAHCGLPAPERIEGDDPHLIFCCAGCRTAYAVIQASGLGAYYLYRGQAGAVPSPVRGTGRAYSEYDSAEFAERYVERRGDLAGIELFLEGIHCSACVWLVERLPRLLPGVAEARFDLGRSALQVVFDPSRVRLRQIARTLDELGYPPHPAPALRNASEVRRDRALLTRLGVAGALAGNVMLMALALYSGEPSGMDPQFRTLFRWSSFALSIPAVFWCGAVFFKGALAALRSRTPHMDLPVSIALLTGFSGSAWNTLAGAGEVYFDSLALLVFLLLVGRWLQHRHHRRAARAAELIGALAPATARKLAGDDFVDVPCDTLQPGDVVEVRTAEIVPADGVIVRGESSIDASWLTGESLPEDVAAGARVYAGTRNVSAPLRIRVEVAGQATRLGRLMRDVERAQQSRAPIVRLADRVAGRFVLGVLVLAALTLGLWLSIEPSRAFDNAVALLIVTCPCALAMATPLTVSAALRRAARAGIFFKGGEFLEALARPATLVFDKTGTLTEGKLGLWSLSGDRDVMAPVRAAEARSAHPIGRALVAAFPNEPELEADGIVEHAGAGVQARVAGHQVLIGSPDFVKKHGARIERSRQTELEDHAAAGRPAVAIAVDGEVRAVAAFSDELRQDARASLDALRGLGYGVAVLSGDQREVVASVAARLGDLVEARGGMSPGDKLAWIETARSSGPVVMIGDGVNDAAAMSAANVGIAVHGGAEASLAAADAFTTEPGVRKIVDAVAGARRTLGVIRRGVAFSLVYNAIGVALSVSGLISPLLAAVLMPLSSLTVVGYALRARTFDAPSDSRAG